MSIRGRSRGRSLLLAMASGVVLLLAAATPALSEALRGPVINPGSARGLRALDRWHDVAARFERAGTAPDHFYAAADAASVLAQEVRASGWRSAAVPRFVEALLATANPDGGYGLARRWDAFQDGTVNPASTSYTATTVGHVGPILLAGHQAGVIPAAVVDRTLDWVLDLRRPAGRPCLPYSASRHDTGKACVWNVHFGAAAWAKIASAATGHRPDDAAALVAGALSLLPKAAMDPVTGYLPYSSTQTRPQDIGHQLWTAISIDVLRGNRAALGTMLRGSLWRAQARRFRDYNVASAMSGISLADCRYATDPLVLTYAASTARGTPYAFKALADQARQVAATCFTPSGVLSPRGSAGRLHASTLPATGLMPPGLG